MIEAIAYDEEQMEIITTQPWIVAHWDQPRPTREEIDLYFERLRFTKAPITEEAPIYFQRRIGVIIADAHDQNILRDERGTLSPIDLVVGRPGTALRERIDAECQPAENEFWPHGLS